MEKRTIDEVTSGLEIRKDRLVRLNEINAPDIIIQNEMMMIDELNKELDEYNQQMKAEQKLHIIGIMNADEDSEL